jgi:hypothetical protein
MMMSASKEDRIKAEAYNRWEKEGRPHGEHERHWREASEAVDVPKGAKQLESEGTTQAVTVPLTAKPKRTKTKKVAAG